MRGHLRQEKNKVIQRLPLLEAHTPSVKGSQRSNMGHFEHPPKKSVIIGKTQSKLKSMSL